MKKIKYIYGIIALTLLSISCTSDFKDINTNTNAPVDVQPSLLLRNVIWDYGEQMSYEGFVSGSLLGQYFTAVDFNLFDRHSLLEPQFGGNPWPILYTNLRDNQIILNKSLSNPTHAVYEGPARIMKAFIASAITDIFGDVPYSEAVAGKEGIINPAYDSQEDIYLSEEGILDNLRKAVDAIDNYSGTIKLEGDILYNGDLQLWKKMANSLRLKYLIRISAKTNVSVEFFEIFASGDYIQDNSENATFDFTDGEPNNFRIATARVGDFNIYVMSSTIQEVLNGYNDPRMATFFRPTSSNPSTFNGLLNGPDASNLSISIGDYSLAGSVFRENTSALNANFITAWETKLLIAEAANKGLIFANPKVLYEEGVALSFEYWDTALPADYLTTGKAAYNPTTGLEQIITQKWLSNIVNGFEGWIEYRRTGFPALKTVAASLNNDLIPVRMPYPTDEAALNTNNYNAASSLNDNNSINHPVWWDE